MSRRSGSPGIYQGLFLLSFGLYASVGTSPEIPTQEPGSLSSPEEIRGDPLTGLYLRLRKVPVFQGKVEGVELGRREDSLLIELQASDLYGVDSEEIETAWHSTLIQIGHEVYSRLDPGLVLEITGFGPLGESRAKWLSGFFRNEFQGSKSAAIRLFVVDDTENSGRIRMRVLKKDI